jgi:hypothetical protein
MRNLIGLSLAIESNRSTGKATIRHPMSETLYLFS